VSGPGDTVRLAHGAGGEAMRALIEDVFLRGVVDAEARAMDDGAAIPFGDRWLVVTTDAHVVQPAFFPGGDIGRLSVCGTVNDLAMMGATELVALTATVIVEEGYPIADLRRVAASMRAACDEAGGRLLAGDTKVMRKGELDGLALSSSGVAVADRVVRGGGVRAGDAILITGTIGDHGLAVLGARHQLGLGDALRSDVAPLNGLVRAALAAGGDAVHAMKDPTRGGVTSALTELARASGVAVRLDEDALPYTDAARAAAELLGIDPLVVANEGKALLAVAPDAAPRVLAALRVHPLGVRAAIIGRAVAGEPGEVVLDTGFGTRRLRERDGDPLPRIC
jgi:hydrogenase expression/formation protein HypE